MKVLKNETIIILKWFKNNEMKPNPDKCHLIVCNANNAYISLENEKIDASDSVKLLGINIDKDLKFNEHVSNLCKKGNQKLHALARI